MKYTSGSASDTILPISLETNIPTDYLLRPIDRFVELSAVCEGRMAMDSDNEKREREKIVWLRKNMPMIAAVMSGVTFVVIKFAGHTNKQSLLAAAIMFAFVVATFKFREWFGVKGFIAVMVALFLLTLRIQKSGWL